MAKYLSFALVLLLALGCKNEKPTEETPEVETPPAEVVYSLICKNITQEGDKNQHHEVYAVVDTDTMLVGTIESCERILPEKYPDYEIPEDAFDAVGGTNAEDLTYAVYLGKSPEGKITARIGHNYPGKESGSFDYRSMVILEEGDINPRSDINLAAMVGSYVHDGENASHILYIGVNNRNLMGQLFSIDSALPEQEDSLMVLLSQTPPELLSNIQVDLSTLTFNSLKGPGKFNYEDDQIKSILFTKWEGKRKKLEMEKKEIGVDVE